MPPRSQAAVPSSSTTRFSTRSRAATKVERDDGAGAPVGDQQRRVVAVEGSRKASGDGADVRDDAGRAVGQVSHACAAAAARGEHGPAGRDHEWDPALPAARARVQAALGARCQVDAQHVGARGVAAARAAAEHPLHDGRDAGAQQRVVAVFPGRGRERGDTARDAVRAAYQQRPAVARLDPRDPAGAQHRLTRRARTLKKPTTGSDRRTGAEKDCAWAAGASTTSSSRTRWRARTQTPPSGALETWVRPRRGRVSPSPVVRATLPSGPVRSGSCWGVRSARPPASGSPPCCETRAGARVRRLAAGHRVAGPG